MMEGSRQNHRAQEQQQLHQLKDQDVQFSDDYQTWQKQWLGLIQLNPTAPSLISKALYASFKEQFGKAVILCFISNQLHYLTPLLAYLIFAHIQTNTYHSLNCVYIITFTCMCILTKIVVRYYGNLLLDELGRRMYCVLSRAMLQKVLKVKMGMNGENSPSEMGKIMHIHVEKVLSYPENKINFFMSIYGALCILITIIYISGWIGLVAIVVFALSFSFRLYLVTILRSKDVTLNTHTQNRVAKTIQIFNMIKFIKVNALQHKFYSQFVQFRQGQLSALDGRFRLQIYDYFLSKFQNRIILVLIYVISIASDTDFSAATMFGAFMVFAFFGVGDTVSSASYLSQTSIALQKIQEFLISQEIDLSYIQRQQNQCNSESKAVSIVNGNFSWTGINSHPAQTGQQQGLTNINLRVNQKQSHMVVGSYGSGKSSLIDCLLGQMNKIGEAAIKINGSVAYCSQKPWIMSDTVRNNILFGHQYHHQRYLKAIHYSCLAPDIEMMENSDHTVIGQRGCTISGGQKARVALARALYSQADIYIFDDILSAVDVHVGSFIFNKAIKQFLRGKTVLLITHSLHLAPFADIVTIVQNGKITDHGPYEKLQGQDIFKPLMSSIHNQRSLAVVQLHQNEHLLNIQTEVCFKSNEQKQRQASSVCKILRQYLKRSGSHKLIIFLIFSVLLYASAKAGITFWLKHWLSSPDKSQPFYCLVYILFVLLISFYICLVLRILQTSPVYLSIFQQMISSLLYSPLYHFQSQPVASLIHPFAKDLPMSDKVVANKLTRLLSHFSQSIGMVSNIVAILILAQQYAVSTMYLLFATLTVSVYFWNLSACLDLIQLQQRFKIPINTTISQIIDGSSVIRAYAQTQYMLNLGNAVIKNYSNVKKAVIRLTRVVEIVSGLYSGIPFVVFLLLLFKNQTTNENHILLVYSVVSQQPLLKAVNQWTVQLVKKLKYYGKCEQVTQTLTQHGYQSTIMVLSQNHQQHDFIQEHRNFQIKQGCLQLNNLSVRYRSQLKEVLKRVSLSIKGGQKIGIVGRTGSGKSTFLMSILRLLQPSNGSILIDGQDISKLGLKELRSSLSIIVQDHFLMEGTIRHNIDPNGEYMDSQIIEKLKNVDIWPKLLERQGLQTKVAEGGTNFSAGECQLLSIVRALLSSKKIVLIDEATSNIDIHTDQHIQQVMRQEFKNSTVLTVAHRINTIMDSDRIMVMDNGMVAQFDKPQNLMKDQSSLLAQLVRETSHHVRRYDSI